MLFFTPWEQFTSTRSKMQTILEKTTITSVTALEESMAADIERPFHINFIHLVLKAGVLGFWGFGVLGGGGSW